MMTGCNFLDKDPDMRANIQTQEQVRLLLTSGYSDANYAPVMEFSSDNIVDNNAPDAAGHTKSINSLSNLYNEVFQWKPVESTGQQDSPKYIWDAHYMAIATANAALTAIDRIEKETGKDLSAERAEALLIRAYHHFQLACVFCHAYNNSLYNSEPHSGLVYMTTSETTVKPIYTRETLLETYDHIQADLEKALEMMNDGYYTVPKYHLNTKAAYAFAARFYLYKGMYEECVACANKVLGEVGGDPEAVRQILFRANVAKNDYSSPSTEKNFWNDANEASNLMLQTYMSQEPYTHFSNYGRFQCNGDAADYTTLGEGPNWTSRRWVALMSLWLAGGQEYGIYYAKDYYYFEYTDKVNGYGYIHAMGRPFTTNETLLCRAEALAWLGQKEAAIRDLRTWEQGYDAQEDPQMTTDPSDDSRCYLTEAMINSFYNSKAGSPYAPAMKYTETTGKAWPAHVNKNIIYCCLHFRRIETLHDGLRWMDIKRYGIEISHKYGTDAVQKLTYDSRKRAIELPREVRDAGLEANDPANNTGGKSEVIAIFDKPSATSGLLPMTEKDAPITVKF